MRFPKLVLVLTVLALGTIAWRAFADGTPRSHDGAARDDDSSKKKDAKSDDKSDAAAPGKGAPSSAAPGKAAPGKAAGGQPGKARRSDDDSEKEDDASKKDDDSDDEALADADVPAPIRAAAAAVWGKAGSLKFSKETEDGVVLYEAEHVAGDAKASATFTASGDLVEVEEHTDAAKLPEAVRRRIEALHPGAAVARAETVRVAWYDVRVKTPNGVVELRLDAAGRVAPKTPVAVSTTTTPVGGKTATR